MLRIIAAAALIAATSAAFAADAVVLQHNHLFDPARLTVKRGTTVHFTNAENVVHHAYADSSDFSFDSGDIPPGGDFAVLFDKTGHVSVRCAIHPQMRTEIDVED